MLYVATDQLIVLVKVQKPLSGNLVVEEDS